MAADLILPAAMWVEKEGAYRQRRAAARSSGASW
jgi:anaerobic selenocysteine-containing dehydrogenase